MQLAPAMQHLHQQPLFVTGASFPLVGQRRQHVLGLCACAASFSISDVRHMADPIEHHYYLLMTCALQRHRIYHGTYDRDSVSAACLGRSNVMFGYSNSQQPVTFSDRRLRGSL
jgi:hypothetical protein